MKQAHLVFSLALFLMARFASSASGGESAENLREDRGLRRPVSIERVGSLLYVAHRDAGSVSVVDLQRREVLVERLVARECSDIARVDDGRLAVTDSGANEVVLLELRDAGRDVRAIGRFPSFQTPVAVEPLPGDRVAVASLWARRVTILRLVDGKELETTRMLDLDFAPRRLLSIEAGLVVADSFGGRVALVDTEREEVAANRSLEGHNIRGLTLSADGRSLLVAHQQLNPRVPTTRSRVFWGAVVGNLLRTIPLSHLTDRALSGSSTQPEPLTRWSLHPIGEPGRAAGDPSRLAVFRSGALAVLSEGVDELHLLSPVRDVVRRVRVGDRPVDLSLSEDESEIYVANMFGDSLSVVDVESAEVVETIPFGTMRRLSTRERGEVAFHDSKLSLDGWVSCHSCHTDGHTNGLLNDNLGDGTEGTPKKILALGDTGSGLPWGWTGSKYSLDSQISRSVKTTMQLENPDEDAITALIAFVGRIESPPSVLEARGEIDAERVEAGRKVFQEQGCERCHGAPNYSSEGKFRVGLSDEAGQTRFNPPSLLGVSQRRGVGYFHDGRARTLRDVFETHRHPKGERIPKEELAALLYFLRSL